MSDFELEYVLIFNFSLNPAYVLDMKQKNALFLFHGKKRTQSVLLSVFEKKHFRYF